MQTRAARFPDCSPHEPDARLLRRAAKLEPPVSGSSEIGRRDNENFKKGAFRSCEGRARGAGGRGIHRHPSLAVRTGPGHRSRSPGAPRARAHSTETADGWIGGVRQMCAPATVEGSLTTRLSRAPQVAVC